MQFSLEIQVPMQSWKFMDPPSPGPVQWLIVTISDREVLESSLLKQPVMMILIINSEKISVL